MPTNPCCDDCFLNKNSSREFCESMFRLKKPKNKFAKKNSKKEITINEQEAEHASIAGEDAGPAELEQKYKEYLEKLPKKEHALFGDENWTISDQVRDL